LTPTPVERQLSGLTPDGTVVSQIAALARSAARHRQHERQQRKRVQDVEDASLR
jgi:hypothetical protein